MTEIERLQKNLQQKSSKLEQLQARLEGEQDLSRDLRIENSRLKTEMSSIKSDSDSKDEKIEDLRSHIRRYGVRNLEMSIRFSLKSRPSERFPRPEMSQIKAKISLRTNVKLIFH